MAFTAIWLVFFIAYPQNEKRNMLNSRTANLWGWLAGDKLSNANAATVLIRRLTEPVLYTLRGGLAHVLFGLRGRDESAFGK